MHISGETLERILSDRHRGLGNVLWGLTVGALATITAAYLKDRLAFSSDYLAAAVAVFLIAGWAVLYFRSTQSAKQARKLSEIISSRAFRHAVDRKGENVIIEQVAEMGRGNGSRTQVVIEREIITADEANRIGLALEPIRQGLFLVAPDDNADQRATIPPVPAMPVNTDTFDTAT